MFKRAIAGLVLSGAARIFDARGDQPQWLPLTEITKFKNITIIKIF
jgi:hypothetical protein